MESKAGQFGKVNLGNPFSFDNFDPKVFDIVFLPVSAGTLFSTSPCFFVLLGFLFGLSSYQLQEYIHRIWMNMVHLSVQ